ncbi:hypothetical protein IWW38_005063 [Coemansia aciculifera]|uniref:Uncharacterized protein n=1 Tax=Coemansia aciculifera TaxID=417176 RepID=A0ACC1LW93_9FUNG|nr:hypothetical protein IWW38_005063 [Coemansia aciculifera]
MSSFSKREVYDQVGDYLYSQDLCVGVFDGTNFNSGTCVAANLTSSSAQYPTSSMIIRNNLVQSNTNYLASVLQNLTQTTQAQCVMTDVNSTACWVWDSELSQCQRRCYYQKTNFVRTDACNRTVPVDGQYAVYVRRSDFRHISTAVPSGGTLKRMVVVASIVLAMIL